MKNPFTKYKLIFTLLLAFFLRVNGLDFGLPFVFHDDEHQYVEAGLAFLQDQERLSAQLQRLNNPPLFKSTLGLLYSLYAHLLASDPAEMQTAIDTQIWRTFFHYVGRFASAATGFLTVALLYPLGKRLYDRQVGIIASFLLAVSFLHVRESHFAVNDAPLTLLTLASLYTSAGIFRRGRWFDYLITGFLIGLAAATKYTGGYLVIALLLAHWLRARRTNAQYFERLLSPRLLFGLALAPVGFILGAPVVLTSWPEMFRRMDQLAEYGRLGYHDLLLDVHGGWIFYLKTIAWGGGVLMFLAIIIALIGTLRYRSPQDFILVTFPLLLYLLMGYQKMFFVRFILPALPPLTLLVAVWIKRLNQASWGLYPLSSFRPLRAPSSLIVAALLALQPLVTSIWFGILLSRIDTREMAVAWIKTNIPEGNAIYAEIQAVPRESVTGRVSLPYVQPDELAFDYSDPLHYYRERGVQFLITSDYHHERRFADPEKESGRQRWVATLDQLSLIQEFQPYWLPGQWFTFDQRYGPWYETLLRRNPGPIIRIYAIDPKPNWYRLNPYVESNQIPGKVSVFGYELASTQKVVPGNTLVDVAIYWLNKGWQDSNELFVAIVDSAGFEVTREVAELSPEFEAEFRAGNKIVKSVAHLPIPVGTPPGKYSLQWGVSDRNQLQTLGTLPLEQASITITELPASTGVTDTPQTLGESLAPGISLAAYELFTPDELLENTLVLGQDNWLVLLWWADRDVDKDYQVYLSLLDARERVAATWEGQPVHNTYGTSNWQAQQLIRDPWNLKLPDTVIPAAPYRLVLTLRDDENVVGEKRLGDIMVSSRPRSSKIPAMQQAVDAIWGEAIRLLGFNIRAVPTTANSGWLELDLYWQSSAPVETDYEVRVNVEDAQGQVVLAQEGHPQGGSAPTHTWQSGEVVHDFHSLPYSELSLDQKYRLEIALVNSQTRETLPVEKDGEIEPSLLLTSWP